MRKPHEWTPAERLVMALALADAYKAINNKDEIGEQALVTLAAALRESQAELHHTKARLTRMALDLSWANDDTSYR